MKHTSRRRWRPARLMVAAGLTLGITAGSSGLAAGQAEGAAIRARGSAMATGARFVFSRPGSAPVEPPIDARFGAAGGSLDEASDNAYGFASSFYPGDTPATPGSVIPLLGFPIGGQIFPAEHPVRKSYDSLPGLIPPWPMVTQGSYPGDPGRRVDLLQDVTGTIPAPLPTSFAGMTQETTVDKNLVVAATTIDTMTMTGLTGLNPGFAPLAAQLAAVTKPYAGGQPGVGGDSLTARGLNSTYKILSEGARVRSSSEIVVREIDLAGGLLQFFRVRSFATHEGTAQGVRVVSHGTEVGLAKVLGLEVTFDDRGAVLADRRIPPDERDAVEKVINAVLSQSPFSVRATNAKVDGTRVTETALTVVFEGQEPVIPGMSFLGRHTKITLEFGSLDADLSVSAVPPALPGPSAEGGVLAGPPAPAMLDFATGAAAVSIPSLTVRPPASSARGEAVSASGGETAIADTGEAAAGGTAAATAAGGVAAPAVGHGKGEQFVLLPGVVASAAEHRRIAGQVQDSARRLVLLAGLGAAVAVVIWRGRPAGLLR